MATIRSYTTIEQSRKLAEILPLESADMWWNYYSVTTDFGTPQIVHLNTPWVGSFNWYNKPDNIPCWSLAALLSVLPDHFYDKTGRKTLGMDKGDTYYNIFYENKNSYIQKSADNPIDACVAMIERLHELNLL